MKKIFSVLFTIIAVIAIQKFSSAQAADIFSDVSDSFHRQAILELSARGVVQGYSDGTFRPDQPINRAEFLKVLIETKGDYSPSRDPSGYDIESPVGITLTDIMFKAWFIPYVRYALQQEIIHGYEDGTFKPTRNVNLAETFKMIFKTFGLPTVQFIRAPDNWYDYYTAALDGDFELETQLNARADIGKEITRGEMATLILYFEEKARLQAAQN